MTFGFGRPFTRRAVARTAPISTSAPLSFSTAHGRVYARGAGVHRLMTVRGAALHEKGWVELSLTRERLSDARAALGLTPEAFAAACSPELLRWGRAVKRVEDVLASLHVRLATGWRLELPWDCDTDRLHALTGQRIAPAFDHQRVMASVACSVDGAGFFADTGTGKTRAAIESIKYQFGAGRVKCVLVVCPKRAFGTWRNECALWAPRYRVEVLGGAVAERRQRLAMQRTHTIYVTNYEALDKLAPVAGAIERLGFVLDEGHKLRNPQTLMSKAALKISTHSAWRLLLTASPILQGLQDAWAQMYAIDVGLTFGANFVQYRREWLDADDWGKLTAKPGAAQEIGVRMRKRGLFFAKRDCLDLPPEVRERVEIELPAEQQAAYNQMAEQLAAELDSAEGVAASAQNQLVAMMKLSHITSGHLRKDDGTVYHFTPNPKLDACVDIVRENINAQQIVVWAAWREDIEMLMRVFADLHPVRVDGTVTEAESSAAVDALASGRARLFIGNQQSGGASLNLQAASLAIYYSQRFNLEHRVQSEGRTLRAGSNRHAKVTYLDLVVPGTIDDIVARALHSKQRIADVVGTLREHIARSSH